MTKGAKNTKIWQDALGESAGAGLISTQRLRVAEKQRECALSAPPFQRMAGNAMRGPADGKNQPDSSQDYDGKVLREGKKD